MNCKKERYSVTISEAAYNQMCNETYQRALQDGVRQGVAATLLALEKGLGWRRKRLERVFDMVNTWLEMPEIFGKSMTGDDVIGYLKSTYRVDMDALKIEVEL